MPPVRHLSRPIKANCLLQNGNALAHRNHIFLLLQDIFTSLTGASKPHHMVDGAGVVLGYSHFGMLAAARWVLSQTHLQLRKALQENPGYHLKVIGHSLGGGTAALFTMM